MPGTMSDEAQSGFVDAIAESGGRRAVVEHVAQVGVAQAAQDFGAVHEEAVVGLGVDVFGGDGRGVAGPAGAGIELGGGAEERVAAADAAVESGGFRLIVGAGEGRVGGAAARGPILLRGELAAPVAVGMRDLLADGRADACGRLSSNSTMVTSTFASLLSGRNRQCCEPAQGHRCDHQGAPPRERFLEHQSYFRLAGDRSCLRRGRRP